MFHESYLAYLSPWSILAGVAYALRYLALTVWRFIAPMVEFVVAIWRSDRPAHTLSWLPSETVIAAPLRARVRAFVARVVDRVANARTPALGVPIAA